MVRETSFNNHRHSQLHLTPGQALLTAWQVGAAVTTLCKLGAGFQPGAKQLRHDRFALAIARSSPGKGSRLRRPPDPGRATPSALVTAVAGYVSRHFADVDVVEVDRARQPAMLPPLKLSLITHPIPSAG